MMCPKCGKKMALKRSDTSLGKKGARYSRKLYRCTKDDAWVTVEVRKKGEV
jgi:hypothetical protein